MLYVACMIAILMALCYMYDSYFVVALLTSWTCCGHRILNAKTMKHPA